MLMTQFTPPSRILSGGLRIVVECRRKSRAFFNSIDPNQPKYFDFVHSGHSDRRHAASRRVISAKALRALRPSANMVHQTLDQFFSPNAFA